MARYRSMRTAIFCIAFAALLGICQAEAARGSEISTAQRRARTLAEARTLGPVARLRRLQDAPVPADDDATSAGAAGASPTAVAPVAPTQTPVVPSADPPAVAAADPPAADPPAQPADATAATPPADDPVDPAPAASPPAAPAPATPTSTPEPEPEPQPAAAAVPSTTPAATDPVPAGAADPPATATTPTVTTATTPDDDADPPATVTALPPVDPDEEDDDPLEADPPQAEEPETTDPPDEADSPATDPEEEEEDPPTAVIAPDPTEETDPPSGGTDPPGGTPPTGIAEPPTTSGPDPVPPTGGPVVAEPGPDPDVVSPVDPPVDPEVDPPVDPEDPDVPIDPTEDPEEDPEEPTTPDEPGDGTGITGDAAPDGGAAEDSPDGEDDGPSTGIIVGIAAGVAVAATLAIVVICFCLRKCCRGGGSKKQEPAVPPYAAHPYYAEQESMPMGSSYGYVGGTSKYNSGPQGSSYPPMPGAYGGHTGSAFSHSGTAPTGHPMPHHGSNVYMAHSRPHSRTGSTASGYTSEDPLHMHTRPATPTQTHTETDVGTWRTMVTQNRTIAAPDDTDKLNRALDNFAQSGTPFLGRFLMLSAAHRRVGGQGMVQFARGMHDGEEYAIKFFTQRAAFDREHELYSNPVLRGMMPAITHIEPNTDGSARSITGWSMPPCIVIERGESLDKWALRIKPDFTTILQVLTHVATRLQRLHDNGLVHRDLKPGNVLWRPQHLEWTLIDFGCAAGTDSEAPLSFSLKYAAPEVVHAYEAKHRTIIASPAMDMWALGLMAYELLTDSSAFPPGTSAKAVCDQIAGRQPLPWEDPEDGDARLAKLRMLRRSLTSCLARDPAERPTSTELLASWNRLFDSVAGERTYAPA